MSDWVKKAMEESSETLEKLAEQMRELPEMSKLGAELERVDALDVGLATAVLRACVDLIAEHGKQCYMAGVKHGVELERAKQRPRKPTPRPRLPGKLS